VFEAALTVDIFLLLVAIIAVLGLTVLTGALGNRRTVNRPPLEVLRSEG
jgi:hypothetical protein